MTDGIDIPLLDQPVGQQVQRPALLPARRRTAGRSNQEGFGFPVEDTGFAAGLLFARKSRLQATQDEALAHVGNGSAIDLDLLTYGLVVVSALGMLGIGEQEDFGAFAFRLLMFVGACEDFGLLALLPSEKDVIHFGRHNGCLPENDGDRIPKVVPSFYLERLLAVDASFLIEPSVELRTIASSARPRDYAASI